MSWPFGRREPMGTATQMVGVRTSARSKRGKHVSRDEALGVSAVWACVRLRADLVSTSPIEVYRNLPDGTQVDMPTPPVLQAPGGGSCDVMEWMYSTQVDLDTIGNTFGIIKARDGAGMPSLIELVPVTDVTVQVRGGVIKYKIAHELFDAGSIWHEKQFTTSGIPVGLSPIAYGAASMTGYLSAQNFAADWFSNGGVPAAHLKNTNRTLTPDQANDMKDKFKAAMSNGDVFVSGNDWDYDMIAAKASESQFLEERHFGLVEACRYHGVPADMIDVETGAAGSKLIYANITQRNLQFLIMNMGPAIRRRENALSKVTARPRFVTLNTDKVLAMDMKSRFDAYKVAVDARAMTPNEWRARENMPPLTPDQVAEFAALFPSKPSAPIPTGAPA